MTTNIKTKPISEIHAILFDKDGTLFQFEKPWKQFCRTMFNKLAPDNPKKHAQLAQACGYDIKTDQFIPGSIIVGGSISEICRIWAEIIPEHNTENIISISTDTIADLKPETTCDLKKITQKLIQDGYVLGVITNDMTEAAKRQLQNAGVVNQFKIILGCDSGFEPKPSPEPINHFCTKTGIKPENVAMIGDSTHDMDAADAAKLGIKIGVLTGPASAEQLQEKCDIILNSIAELPEILQKYPPMPQSI